METNDRFPIWFVGKEPLVVYVEVAVSVDVRVCIPAFQQAQCCVSAHESQQAHPTTHPPSQPRTCAIAGMQTAWTGRCNLKSIST